MTYAKVRVGIQVTRQDCKWIPFTYRMFWCKQREVPPPESRLCPVSDCAQESISMLGELGGVPGEHKMKVGESRRYWATLCLHAYQDYWGECDEDVEFIRIRRAK